MAGAWDLEIVTDGVFEAIGVCQGRECRKARPAAAMPALLGTPTTHSPVTGQPGDEDTTKMSEEAAQEEEPGGVCKVFPEGATTDWSTCCCLHARRSSCLERWVEVRLEQVKEARRSRSVSDMNGSDIFKMLPRKGTNEGEKVGAALQAGT